MVKVFRICGIAMVPPSTFEKSSNFAVNGFFDAENLELVEE
jgi:hypothetical protein